MTLRESFSYKYASINRSFLIKVTPSKMIAMSADDGDDEDEDDDDKDDEEEEGAMKADMIKGVKKYELNSSTVKMKGESCAYGRVSFFYENPRLDYFVTFKRRKILWMR